MSEPVRDPEAIPSADIHRIALEDREIVLVGTAHISRESVDLVQRVIADERPDRVCVELDEKRYESLARRKSWEMLDLREIMRKKQLATLLINLALASYQKKLGDQMGVQPGAELLAAVQAAEAAGVPVSLCDRDVRVTLRRAWHATSFLRKGSLLSAILASMFQEEEISEEKLRELKESDVLSELMSDLGDSMPELKRVLIDERDTFLAEKIKASPGQRVVAVVGAGHVAGISRALAEDRSDRLAGISEVPPVSRAWQVVGWAVPAVILGSLAYIAASKGAEVAGANLRYWVLANGIPSALGAVLALAHPLTVLTAFAAAPVTSLTPVIGAGYVTAFVQLMLRPPVVLEFETVLRDMTTLRGWWKNRLLRVFLAFLLPGFGSMIGTWIGGVEILSNLF
jgi:pheromone shutdown-related protein TraB